MTADRNPKYSALLQKCRELHDKKSKDYAKDTNVYSNFEFAAAVAEGFSNPVDKVFATMIAIKLARLAELLSTGKTPQNESIEDSFLDLINYCGIFGSYRL